MSFDFSAAGRSARERIPAPEVPMESIRTRSRAARTRGRVQTLVACVAIFAGVVGAGSGLGAKIYDGVRVWLSGGEMSMTMTSFVMVREPTARDLRDAIAHATFPVVLPVGVPAGSHVIGIELTPAERPSVIVIAYHDRAGREGGSFALLDPAVVDREGGLQAASARFGPVYDWRLRGEIVLTSKRVVSKSFLSADDLARVKAAMARSSPTESLAATEPLLTKVTVIGGGASERLALAERYRPRTGQSVLIDQVQVPSIPRLAQRGAPILDMRTYRATKVPYVNGQLDYAHVTGAASKTIAVSPNGVRAIAAVLRSTGAGDHPNACRCEVLFNQPSSKTYWVWTIPTSGSSDGVKKYVVDARTFSVTPAS
jgi:hypothetical protein